MLQDFVFGLSIILRGTINDRLNWAFNLYDLNKDGCITKEVTHMWLFWICWFLGPFELLADDYSLSIFCKYVEISGRIFINDIFHHTIKKTFLLEILNTVFSVSRYTLQEMLDIMKSIYDMMGKYTYPTMQDDAPREHVESFFQVKQNHVFFPPRLMIV